MEWLVAGRVCTRTLVRPVTAPVSRNYSTVIRTNFHRKFPPQEAGEPTPLRTHQDHLEELSKQLRFPLKHNADVSNEAYKQPLGGTEKLPFRLNRTASNRLPIYTDFKQRDVKKQYTVVRKFEGDIKELAKEISLLIPGANIQERAGSLVVEGEHSNLIRSWLLRLGF